MSEPSALRVTIGIACYDDFKAMTAVSLVRALVRFPHELHMTVQRGCYIADGREQCVQEALKVKSDYLVFVDTDMGFQADGLERLLAHRKDVIGAPYNEKRFPVVSTVKLSDGNGGLQSATVNLPTDVFPCAAVGTGFMAINLKRLTACMAPPFFAFSEDAHHATKAWASGPGEDTAFCLRARRAGLGVFCDPTIQLQHFGEYAY